MTHEELVYMSMTPAQLEVLRKKQIGIRRNKESSLLLDTEVTAREKKTVTLIIDTLNNLSSATPSATIKEPLTANRIRDSGATFKKGS
jgi:hypothetical protein